MKRRVFATLLSLLFVAASAITLSAHGDKKHVIGTIEKLNSGSVTVKTRDGKSVEVKLVPSTVYVARVATADKPAALSDLAVGETVVIHAIGFLDAAFFSSVFKHVARMCFYDQPHRLIYFQL
jgi:hypothetical protein